jgi:acyl-coenzyme A thioesterase PaaI-like protein
MNESGKYLPTYKGCVVCGEKAVNPNTLGLKFRITETGVETRLVPGKGQEGYRGVVHGGIIASILDETIGWAIAVLKRRYFITAELSIRYLKPLPLEKEVVIKGWVTEQKNRSARGEGMVIDADGIVYAKASGRYFILPGHEARVVHDYLTFEENDVDILESDKQDNPIG